MWVNDRVKKIIAHLLGKVDWYRVGVKFSKILDPTNFRYTFEEEKFSKFKKNTHTQSKRISILKKIHQF